VQHKQASEAQETAKIRTAATLASQNAERNFPLADKMMMLIKELEKQSQASEPGPDIALACRLDVLCFKVF
jgi:hypothetical protein